VTLLEAFILGLVEGVTEYLPVSSTGHLILVSALLGLDAPEMRRPVDAFNVVIQGGAVLAVLGLYRGRVGAMARGLFGRDEAGRRLLARVLLAFLPAAALGAFFEQRIEEQLFRPGPVLAALALGGVAMILVGRLGLGRALPLEIEQLRLRHALLIGVIQCLALWPGASRSMVTILAGLIVGLRAQTAAEFSFLLGLPTLGGACVYKAAMEVARPGGGMFALLGALPILTGLVVATVSAAVAARWLVAFLGRRGLAPFGWYRLALCAALALLEAQGWLRISP
jgi:undecaprenyl-diphosphatase